jgi:signal recognition particle subunit SRP54
MDKALKGVEISDDAFKPIEAMISSMTPAERSNPSLINGSRKERIARGSGTTIVEVNRFLKQFEQTSKMMRKVQQMKRR